MVTVVCNGSLMDGLPIDLVRYCGLAALSEAQEDLLWNTISDLELVNQCDSAELVVTGDIDEMPGQSDEFYQLETDDVEKFKGELRQVINSILKG